MNSTDRAELRGPNGKQKTLLVHRVRATPDNGNATTLNCALKSKQQPNNGMRQPCDSTLKYDPNHLVGGEILTHMWELSSSQIMVMQQPITLIPSPSNDQIIAIQSPDDSTLRLSPSYPVAHKDSSPNRILRQHPHQECTPNNGNAVTL